MYLSQIIDRLQEEDPNRIVPFGFWDPHSYRGDYQDLSFEPARDVTIGSMLECAKKAIGETYEGWKGGEYKMSEWSDCYLAIEGTCGEEIGEGLLGFMLGEETPSPWAHCRPPSQER